MKQNIDSNIRKDQNSDIYLQTKSELALPPVTAFLPPETQRINMIFCPHGTADNVKFAKEELAKILRPELKDEVKLIFWHELAAPVDFPADVSGLKDLTTYCNRKHGLMLPRVNWKQELENGTLSKNGERAFQAIFNKLNEHSAQNYENAFSVTEVTARLKTESQSAWREMISHVFEYGKAGWKVEHKLEPINANGVFQLILADYNKDLITTNLFKGDTSKALWHQAKQNYYFHKSAEERDNNLAKAIKQEFDPKIPVINICIRGNGHADLLETAMISQATPFVSSRFPKPNLAQRLIPLEEWKAVFKEKHLPDKVVPLLARELILYVLNAYLTEANGYRNEEFDRVQQIAIELKPNLFLDYLENLDKGQKTAHQLCMGAMLWYANIPEVKSNHLWNEVYDSMMQSGHFK